MPILHVRIPDDLAEWLEHKCPARGDASKLVRQLLTAEQMKEAVAPLVPEAPKRDWKGTAAEWAAFEEGAGFVTPEPKPKARRKKMVGPAGVAEAMKADGWKILRCNRGACTGTIKPNSGRCLRCNQIPLKESK